MQIYKLPPEDVIIGYRKIKKEKHDISNILLKGIRLNRQKEDNFTYLLSKIVRILLGFNIEDINGQPKIFHKKLINYFVDVPSDSSFDAFVLYNARMAQLELVTFPVEFKNRFYGESHMGPSIIGKTKSGIGQLKNILLLSWLNRWQEQNIFWQSVRYTITGLLTTTINYISYLTSLIIFDIYYVFASILGAVSGIFIGFFMHRRFTFRAPETNSLYQFLKFIVVVLSSMLLYPISIFVAVNYYGVKPEYGQAISIPFSAIINFLGSKLWAFRLEPAVQNIIKSWK